MKRRVGIRSIYLLFLFVVILFGFVISTTFAKFPDNYITSEDVVGFSFDFDINISDINEYQEIFVKAGEDEVFNVNITNNSDDLTYYGLWYRLDDIDKLPDDVLFGKSINTDINTCGAIESGDEVTISFDIVNNSDNDIKLDMGVLTSLTSVNDIEYLEGKYLIPNVVVNSYAIYSIDDSSLTFVKSIDPINKGDKYKDKIVSEVYSGFEEEYYNVYFENDFSDVPWYNVRKSIKSVVFEDKVLPNSTAYWFYEFINCESLDLSKLDISKVRNMGYMFYKLGYEVDNFKLDVSSLDTGGVTNMKYLFSQAGYSSNSYEIIGLEKWNTSLVQDTSYMFDSMGYSALNFRIGDISKWDTSSCYIMDNMFYNMGYNSLWNLDCSLWDVRLVTSHIDFNFGVDKKIIIPNWVNENK